MSIKDTYLTAVQEAKEARRKEDKAYNERTDARNRWFRNTTEENLATYQYMEDNYTMAKNTAETKEILAKRARLACT